ncbi:hypothetical protein J6590_026330 [Homalodisca vitripennis]|nr:hypothetical protein J6590_026330 [Homalodisca vitripennis]
MASASVALPYEKRKSERKLLCCKLGFTRWTIVALVSSGAVSQCSWATATPSPCNKWGEDNNSPCNHSQFSKEYSAGIIHHEDKLNIDINF